MGRWAQRRVAGGGPAPSTNLITIVSATLASGFVLNVSFSAEIDGGDFAAADFSTNASNFEPDSLTQTDPNVLELTFLDDISAEASITYAGSAPGVLTPQTVVLT